MKNLILKYSVLTMVVFAFNRMPISATDRAYASYARTYATKKEKHNSKKSNRRHKPRKRRNKI